MYITPISDSLSHCGSGVWLVISKSRKKEWAVAQRHHRRAAIGGASGGTEVIVTDH